VNGTIVYRRAYVLYKGVRSRESRISTMLQLSILHRDEEAHVFSLKRPSTVVFLTASLLLVGIKLLFRYYPGNFTAKGQAEAFTWPLVTGIIVIGLLGLLTDRSLSAGGRFPEPFTDPSREKRGLVIATTSGVVYGFITLASDLAGSARNPVALTSGWPHVPWPWSVPFYTFGAIFLEFLLRLGALSILVWFFHVVLFRRRWFVPTFWVINLAVASYEIQPAVFAATAAQDWRSVALAPLQPLYWTNVVEGCLLFRYGWFSPIVFRLSFYLIWHVIYGGLGPF